MREDRQVPCGERPEGWGEASEAVRSIPRFDDLVAEPHAKWFLAILVSSFYAAPLTADPAKDVERHTLYGDRLDVARVLDHLRDGPMTWRQLCATVFAELLPPERRQVSLLGEKTPGNTRHLKWLMAQYPDRKVVALLREPVPTISGMLRRRGRNRHTRAWIDRPLRTCTRLYFEDMAAIAAAAQDAERVLVVRYEDLIRAPQPELERIAGFLGVPPFTPRPPLRADIFPRYVGEAIDPGRDGAARKRLNALQRGYVRYRCAEVLARFYAR